MQESGLARAAAPDQRNIQRALDIKADLLNRWFDIAWRPESRDVTEFQSEVCIRIYCDFWLFKTGVDISLPLIIFLELLCFEDDCVDALVEHNYRVDRFKGIVREQHTKIEDISEQSNCAENFTEFECRRISEDKDDATYDDASIEVDR